MPAGVLYVVATPIGNLRDITLRALDVLAAADAVVAEDTRRTRQLLSAHNIQKPLLSLPAYDEKRRTATVIGKLEIGMNLALCTDAGTPALSDPGAYLIREAVAAGISVIPIPGPSALTAALSASGLRADPVVFLGFGPRTSGKLRRVLENMLALDATIVLFESAPRLHRLLGIIAEVAPDRKVVVAREISKIHETFHRGTATELAGYFSQKPGKGECTVLVGDSDA